MCLALIATAILVSGCDIETTDPGDETEDRTGGEEIHADVPEWEWEIIEDPLCPDGLPEGITEEDLDAWLSLSGATGASEEQLAALCATLMAGIAEAIEHSADDMPPPDATARWAWIKLRSHHALPIPAEVLEAEFPCGEGANGTVLCGGAGLPPDASGDYLVLTMVLDAPVPVGDDELYEQYGFVFDQDGDTSNNFVASPSYPNDTYQGTDRWYQVLLSPGQAPRLEALDATGGSLFPVASAARAVINDDVIMLMVPADEMLASCPAFRMTAFTHHGDYGFEPPNFWAGDAEPPVDQPLTPFCI
jgi:hypothetical protein